MAMNAKSCCLSLIAVLVAAWANDLQAGTFLAASPTGAPVFGQEIYPISRRHAAEIQYNIEHQPLTPACLDTAIEAVSFSVFLPPSLQETTPRVIRSGDSCYRLMSLQW
jgi:hypothetical protein